MGRVTSIVVLAACMAGITQGSYTMFDFEGIGPTSSYGAIGSYMTGQYGSTIVVDDGTVTSGGWAGNASQFLRHGGETSSDMAILFESNPVLSLSTVTIGYVFKESGEIDFRIKAVGEGWDDWIPAEGRFGTMESPNYDAMVGEWWEKIDVPTPGGTEVDVPHLDFNAPAYLLVFMDHGPGSVAVDNLRVEPLYQGQDPGPIPDPHPGLPAPGAVVLGGVGVGLVGWLRRRGILHD